MASLVKSEMYKFVMCCVINSLILVGLSGNKTSPEVGSLWTKQGTP